jgi:hypothetical protein
MLTLLDLLTFLDLTLFCEVNNQINHSEVFDCVNFTVVYTDY